MKNLLREDPGTLVVILTLLFICIFYLSTIQGGHDWGGDFAQYFEHARNIAEGNDYGQTAYIKNPRRSLAPDVYPPGLPLFISIIYIVDGFNLTAIKVMFCFFFFGTLILVYFVFRERLPIHYVAVIIGVLGFYPRFWQYKDMTFSEYPFMFFAFLALYLTQKAFDSDLKGKGKAAFWFGGITLCLIMAAASRVVGGILVPVIIVYYFQKIGKLKYILMGGLGALLCATVLVFIFYDMFEGLLSYLAIIKFSPQTVLYTTERYVILFTHFWNNYNPFILNKAVAIILFLFALSGFYFSCKERITIFDIFFVFYLCFHLTMPWPLNRFLLPLYPIYVYYTVFGINRIIRFKKPQYNFALKLVLLIFVIQMFVAKYMQYDFDYIKPGISTPGAVELFDYINEETDDSSVIVFRKPRVISLFTGRKSLIYHHAPHADLANYLNQQGATHLIIGEFYDDYQFFEGFLNACQSKLELELSNPEFKVYRVAERL